MTNHTVDSYFEKYDYPPHWEQDGVVNQSGIMLDNNEESLVEFSEENEEDSNTLAFTAEQHKALLALLQGISHSQSRNINHLTTQLDMGTGIICTIPNSLKPETFVLDTSATDHVCLLHTPIFSMHKEN